MGKKEKIALAVMLAIAGACLFWSVKNFYLSHTNPAPAWGGEYTEGMRGQPQYINPLLAYQDPDLSLTKLVFSGLYKYDTGGRLIPDLAEGMPAISEDQKQYTINLKRDVKWHNGRSFTADDVIFTVQTLKDPAYKSPLNSQWQSTTIEKLSDYQVKFTTKDISGPFIHNLTLQIIPRFNWSKVEPQNFPLSELNLKEPIGTGPYLIKQISKLKNGKIQSITFESFSGYFLGKPKLGSITIKFYDTGEDLKNAFLGKEIQGFGFTTFDNGFELNMQKDNAQTFTSLLPQYQVIFLNLRSPILVEQAVRNALAAAIDRKSLIDKAFSGHASLPYAPLLFNLGEKILFDKPDFNLEQAKGALDAADWKVDPNTNFRAKKNKILELTLTTNDSPANSKAAEQLVSLWQQLNIKINLVVLPAKQLSDEVIKPRNFDILLFPQKFLADPDPFIFWHSSQSKDPGLNLSGFEDAAADKLITQARTTTNSDIKIANYRQLDDLLLAKLPAIFLDQAEYFYIIDSKIKNINVNFLYEPSARFYDLPNWYMEESRVWK